MYKLEKTDIFDKWLRKLKDRRAKVKILFRLQLIEEKGHFGDCEPIGKGLSELRIHYGKGYRIYLKKKNDKIVILLSGGDKSTQNKDIDKAIDIWQSLK
ncbi:type II toxin-antitoxin system RelE/ParE family toxin [Flammeovirga pectinis]|uniref:Type II toxin-antitoxin system RelE/ParE family toxin n=1 Tax=Flammeovirga pectinis TaxID=2494373 RepID=A0A3S9P183_9BACT|nr:type II toxin-antitoxin system RelE/ParE family toxin [Flammeovirga pectinis]AZQ61932.1 type II toxin-antitoxin system RelE/ParE family toxin [Flammeovirga pectinis]